MKRRISKELLVNCILLSFSVVPAFASPPDMGMIKVDGSSTVYPITEAVAEEFGGQKNNSVKVTVGISGTGGGFKKFCSGETDISDASRPIKDAEIALCKERSIDYIELPVAYDALTVVVNPKNTWVNSITVADLKKIWEPEAQGKITKWNQINPQWPDKLITLYGAGVDSGTYDYFTEAIVGKEHSSRGDFTSSEDDNVLVQGIANDQYALGFFGMAYYLENKDKLKAISIDDEKDANGKGPQVASEENVIKGIYQPLARPLFVYVSKKSIDRPEIKKFISFYLDQVSSLVSDVGYVPLQKEVIDLAKTRVDKLTTGSMFVQHGSQVGISLLELMKRNG